MTTKAMSSSATTAAPRLPAEWERHEATWIGWPHNHSDWPGKFAVIPWVYGEIVRKLAPDERVRILVNDKAHETRARKVLDRAGVDPASIEFFRFPTNRGWTRDFGPIFVHAHLPSNLNPPPTPPGRGGRKRTTDSADNTDA